MRSQIVSASISKEWYDWCKENKIGWSDAMRRGIRGFMADKDPDMLNDNSMQLKGKIAKLSEILDRNQKLLFENQDQNKALKQEKLELEKEIKRLRKVLNSP